MDTLHKCMCVFMIIFRRILLTMINVSEKICRANPNTRFVLNNFSPADCENVLRVGRATDDSIKGRKHCAC